MQRPFRVVCEAIERLLNEVGELRWEVPCRGVMDGIARGDSHDAGRGKALRSGWRSPAAAPPKTRSASRTA